MYKFRPGRFIPLMKNAAISGATGIGDSYSGYKANEPGSYVSFGLKFL
ncbi:hypothetical protein FACS1894172_21450 [Spirochaetia bacterium]|nr:hypothetical protein FACS1894172_21450 [Spirochaetia bacterium]